LGDVVALDFDSTGLCGDFTRPDGLAQTIRQVRPNVIVNAAAHTAVDKAESEPELARTLNALSPGVLAEEAERLGAWLVHYSTDYVFDGSGQRPWVETDAPRQSMCMARPSSKANSWSRELSAAPDFPDQLGLRSAWWQFCENHVATGAGDGSV
jgi:dTDP-4-dehydrorhamnose reductase